MLEGKIMSSNMAANTNHTIYFVDKSSFKPKINTMRFKNSFINRLVFKYELAM